MRLTNRKLYSIIASLLLSLIIYIFGQYVSPKVLSSNISRTDLSRVVKVTDGDTVILENGKRVRLIGIDAPELEHVGLNIKKECFADEAMAYLKNIIEGKNVRLEKDVNDVDRYDRLLRYLYVDNLFINKDLVEAGFAKSYIYMPDVKYQHILEDAQKKAKKDKKGLWGNCKN